MLECRHYVSAMWIVSNNKTYVFALLLSYFVQHPALKWSLWPILECADGIYICAHYSNSMWQRPNQVLTKAGQECIDCPFRSTEGAGKQKRAPVSSSGGQPEYVTLFGLQEKQKCTK